ncbi:hypothetical protein RHMOL_Rhmol12G0235200 [Rhododendron molle]|uniref:Uncharacterized protein n=1 Tax=Rhododendron molle TaxID=49168 RepID=A0ACC0LLE1_RHOML|nr:hypothetical protein RHMOL_Rhmol12G0235200 [Rhododendron molle]
MAKDGKEAIAAVVFRDFRGRIVDGGVKAFSVGSVLQGELSAIRLACVVANVLGLSNIQVESDCKQAIELSVKELDPPLGIAALVLDFKSWILLWIAALVLILQACAKQRYQTNLGIYADLVLALGKKGMMEDIDRLILDLEREGTIPCDDKGLGRLVKALITNERTESTVRIYNLMKRSGWGSTFPSYYYVANVLSKGLRRLGEETIAEEIDAEFGWSCGRLGEYEVLKDLKCKTNGSV